ncbi:MAG: hypothetical protein MR922_04135, partial [Lachnospiraceae bacterium]|nr:hypothetical protein [Lachnospiraceae bacterium]
KQTQSQNPNKTKKDNRKLKFKAFSPLVFSFGKMRGLFSALSINSDWSAVVNKNWTRDFKFST